MAREEKKGIGGSALARIGVAAAIVTLLVVCAVSISNIIKLHNEQAELREENERLQEEKASLETELKNVNDLDYIEEQARKYLKMIKPGEVMFVLDENGKPHVVEPDDKGELPRPEDAGIISGEIQGDSTGAEYYEETYEESYEETPQEYYEEPAQEPIEEPLEVATEEVVEETYEGSGESVAEEASGETSEYVEETYEEIPAEASIEEVPYEDAAEYSEEVPQE